MNTYPSLEDSFSLKLEREIHFLSAQFQLHITFKTRPCDIFYSFQWSFRFISTDKKVLSDTCSFESWRFYRSGIYSLLQILSDFAHPDRLLIDYCMFCNIFAQTCVTCSSLLHSASACFHYFLRIVYYCLLSLSGPSCNFHFLFILFSAASLLTFSVKPTYVKAHGKIHV